MRVYRNMAHIIIIVIVIFTAGYGVLLLSVVLLAISGGIFRIVTNRKKKLKHVKRFDPGSATVAMDTVQTVAMDDVTV